MAREDGLRNIVLFPLSENGLTEKPVFGAPMRVPWAVNMELEFTTSEGKYFADNVTESASKRIIGVNVTMEVSSDAPPELDAKITGKGYLNGMAFVGDEQKTPAFCLAYEITMDNGNLRRCYIYNIGFTRKAQVNKTREEEVEGQTYTYEGVATPLIYTGDIAATMDRAEIEAETGDDKDKKLYRFENFFTKVYLPSDELEERPVAP